MHRQGVQYNLSLNIHMHGNSLLYFLESYAVELYTLFSIEDLTS